MGTDFPVAFQTHGILSILRILALLWLLIAHLVYKTGAGSSRNEDNE